MTVDSTELDRIATLLTYEVMGTAAEPEFDRVTMLAATLLDAPIALITFLDETRLWIKSGFGTDLRDLPRAQSFYTHVIAQPDPLVVLDTRLDARFAENIFVNREPGIRFYAGISLVTPEGARIGVLCVADRVPRAACSERELAALEALAKMATDLLTARRQVLAVERAKQRALLVNALLAGIAQATGVDAALDGVMRALGTACEATSGKLWKRPADPGQVRRISAFGDPWVEHPAELASDEPGQNGGGLLAATLRQRQPLALTLSAPAPFAHDPQVAAARARGLHHLLIIPLAAGQDEFVIALGFDCHRPDLAVLRETSAVVCKSVNPGLAVKADDERLRLLNLALDMASEGMIITKGAPPFEIVYVNDLFCRTTGYAANELVGRSCAMLQGAESDRATLQQISAKLRAGLATSFVLANYRKNGSAFQVQIDLAPITDANGTTTHFVALQRDITEKLHNERQQRELDESFRVLFEANPLPMWMFDPATLQFLMVNQAAITFYGWSRAEFMSMTVHDTKPAGEGPDPAAVAGLRAMSDQWRLPLKRADGSIVWISAVTRPHRIGGKDAIFAAMWDVTELQIAQEHLKRNYEMVRDLAGQLRARTDELTEANRLAKLGTWRLSADRTEMTWSDEIYTLLDRRRSDFPPSYENSLLVVHPDDRELCKRSSPIAGSDCGSRQVEARIVSPDGRLRHVRIEFRPANKGDERGELFGYVQDISERREIQQALMRSEKLAILGHLTGGIAHDFNNLLTVVTLNLEEAIAELPGADELQGILVAALLAAQRGADLTSQLLAYARQAPLRPQATSLATLFASFSPLVRRALGQKHHLRLTIEDERCTPLVDPSQLQAAVLNIVLNAQDAMPDGGEIWIDAASIRLPSPDFPLDDVAPGSYALISVTDQGCGIAPEIIPRIFEPFYTTKTVGAGSGLGLSMVDGFIAQSGGRTVVESQLGAGTTIRLFLPLVTNEDVLPARSDQSPNRRRALLVEDQPAVLATVSRMFTQLGYEVCGVQSADAALAELDCSQDFAVMFTDIVLPGDMDGIELARSVSQRAPNIQIMLTSGFSEYNRTELALPGVELLMKPYKRQDLLDRLNKIKAPIPA